MTAQTKAEAIAEVMDVLSDGSRSDRYLRQAEDGTYFTTPDDTFLDNDGGRYSPPSVKIPVSDGGTEEEDEQWAEALIEQLDTKIDEAGE